MLYPDLRPATVVRRLNRFSVLVETGQRECVAHLPNSGRLHELLAPGHPAYLVAARFRPRAEAPLPWPTVPAGPPTARRTLWDLAVVEVGGCLVSCDARLPPALLAEALALGRVEALAGYRVAQREPPLGAGRADLLLRGPGINLIVETKSITLVEGGVGLFPDAPTQRGARHVRELAAHVAARRGRAAVAFVVQRPDVNAVSPHDRVDPTFGRALREAVADGVELLAFRCAVTLEGIRIASPIPVAL